MYYTSRPNLSLSPADLFETFGRRNEYGVSKRPPSDK